MPINAGHEYAEAQTKLDNAKTLEEKLAALEEMLRTSPNHKGSEALRSDIKNKIAKIKALQKKSAKKTGSRPKFAIKKEGAATIVIVGTTNSGKSTLLARLTNAKPEIASYPFTTRKPEQGILDYHGVKLQLIEIPAIVQDFAKTEDGPALLGIIKSSELIILLFNNPEEKKMLDKELYSINISILIPDSFDDLPDKIWKNLKIIKIFTKQPGKKPNFPPVALRKNATIQDLASVIHKDFIRKFKFARVWGRSMKHQGSNTGLDHKLEDDDIVEIHMK